MTTKKRKWVVWVAFRNGKPWDISMSKTKIYESYEFNEVRKCEITLKGKR